MALVLAVVGARDYKDYSLISQEIEKFSKQHGEINIIVSGGAKGVDSLAAKFAREKSINLQEYIPDWETYGKRAGLIRNTDIINAATHVLAFPSATSRGTWDSINKAKKAGKHLTIIHV